LSEPARPELAEIALYRLRARVLSLYFAITVLCLLGIGVLAVYAIELGPLVGPGVEESFGLAAAMMFLFAALLVHLLDRTYREWPLGRRVHPLPPQVITDERIAGSLRIVVVVAAAALVAYVLAGVLG
jgi:hypothetical protein